MPSFFYDQLFRNVKLGDRKSTYELDIDAYVKGIINHNQAVHLFIAKCGKKFGRTFVEPLRKRSQQKSLTELARWFSSGSYVGRENKNVGH